MSPAKKATGVVIVVDGTKYELDPTEITALDAKAFRAAVGVSLAQVMTDGSQDLDVLAGLVWLARRKRERNLTYEAVASTFTYGSTVDIETAEVEPDPET